MKPFRSDDTTKSPLTGGLTDIQARFPLYKPLNYAPVWHWMEHDDPYDVMGREWREFIATVKVGGRHPIEFGMSHVRYLIQLFAYMEVDDRDSGENVKIAASEQIDLNRKEPWDKAQVIKGLVLRLYEHEALEQITVGGNRVFDPHK